MFGLDNIMFIMRMKNIHNDNFLYIKYFYKYIS